MNLPVPQHESQSTGPATRAVGLAYKPEAGLPRVVFKAAGELAEQALDQGLRLSGPRVVRDAQLLKQLYRLPVDAGIDASLFQAVAILLAHVLALNERLRDRTQSGHDPGAWTDAPDRVGEPNLLHTQGGKIHESGS